MRESYTEEEKKQLLELARTAIGAVLERKKLPQTSSLPENLRRQRSCFVSLHKKDGRLRGCIGNLSAHESLSDNVVHNAVNAAFRDPRFNPMLSPDELADTVIEISVLTPPEKIPSHNGFIVGRHGIILDKDGTSAVFLPQVAPEQGWDKETTLSHLSMKAGLHPNAWREDDAEFSVFEAIVFSEEHS